MSVKFYMIHNDNPSLSKMEMFRFSSYDWQRAGRWFARNLPSADYPLLHELFRQRPPITLSPDQISDLCFELDDLMDSEELIQVLKTQDAAMSCFIAVRSFISTAYNHSCDGVMFR